MNNQNHASSSDSSSLAKYRELVEAMDEAEIESELQSCQRDLQAAQEQYGDIYAEIRSGIRENYGLEEAKARIHRLEQNMLTVAMVIKNRQEAAKETPDPDKMHEDELYNFMQMRRAAQTASLDTWLSQCADAIELALTVKSWILHLTAELPTEGEYNPRLNSYNIVNDLSQDTEKVMMMAYKKTKRTVELLEASMRIVEKLRRHIANESETSHPTVDEIPF